MLRLSRYYNIQNDTVIYSDVILPIDVFIMPTESLEQRLVANIFRFARSIAEMKLTEVQLALYCAFNIFSHGK